MSNKITNAKPMLAYTYISPGKFELIDKPKPELKGSRDAIVRITLGSICTSDLHIKHGSVPRAVPGITVGHEMVGVVEEVGSEVRSINLVYSGESRLNSAVSSSARFLELTRSA